MYQAYDYIKEQTKLLNAVKSAEDALISLAYEIGRLKNGVEIDKEMAVLTAQLQPLLRRHRYSVLAPSIPLSDKTDDYIHPYCKSFRKLHTDEAVCCGADK